MGVEKAGGGSQWLAKQSTSEILVSLLLLTVCSMFVSTVVEERPSSPIKADEESALISGYVAKINEHELGYIDGSSDSTVLDSTCILWLTLMVNVVFTIGQIIAGYLSNSVSLQGDSADMAVDCITCASPSTKFSLSP